MQFKQVLKELNILLIFLIMLLEYLIHSEEKEVLQNLTDLVLIDHFKDTKFLFSIYLFYYI